MSQFKPTEEQDRIFSASDPMMVIRAGAGASKTTTLIKYAEHHPREKFLYLAYNRSVKEDAEGKFGRNVTIKTSHGAAYAGIGYQYAHKLTGNLRNTVVAEALGLKHSKSIPKVAVYTYANRIIEGLNRYLASTDDLCQPYHMIIDAATPMERTYFIPEIMADHANMLYEMMAEPSNTKVPMTHDGYLKLFYLAGMSLGNFDRVLLDEAQDANNVTLGLLRNQASKAIIVGDSNQSIYSFRGAVDAMNMMPDAIKYRLSGSFRFGSEIARVANTPLFLKDAEDYVRGIGPEGTFDFAPNEHSWNAIFKDDRVMYLTRGAYGMLGAAISTANVGNKIYFVGGAENYRFSRVDDVYALKFGLPVKDGFIKEFENYEALKEYGKGDFDMGACITIVESYGRELPERLKLVKSFTTTDVNEAKVIMSTAHRAKGLEFDNVVIGEDFYMLDRIHHFDANNVRKAVTKPEELNLLYVAITRAKKRLLLPKSAKELLSDESLRAQVIAMQNQMMFTAADDIGLPSGSTIQHHRKQRRNRL